MNPITVTRKRWWTGREGTFDPHLFVDIKIDPPGLIITGIKVTGRLFTSDEYEVSGKYQAELPADGIFDRVGLVWFPNCDNRFAVIEAVGPDFHRLFFEAVNAAPLTFARTFKTEPPKNLEQLMERARKQGKGVVLVTGMSGKQAANCIRHSRLSKPTHRWFERNGRHHCLLFYFKDAKAEAIAQTTWELESWRDEYNRQLRQIPRSAAIQPDVTSEATDDDEAYFMAVRHE